MTDDLVGSISQDTTDESPSRPRIVVEHREHAVWLRLGEPAQENRLSRGMLEALRTELSTSASREDCRVIVLTGSDGIFCAGGRIDGLADGVTSAQEAFAASFVRLFAVLDAIEVPVIAAVNGPCHAGGMSLLHASDLAVAADIATFGYPEIKSGLFPMFAMAAAEHALPRKVLFDLWYSGRLFSADEAMQLHLVNEVVSTAELQARVEDVVAGLVGRSSVALGHGRRAYHTIRRVSPDAGMRHAQAALMALLAHSAGQDSPWAATAQDIGQDDFDEELL
ncbi:MAG: hypothetical protein BMS9Abin12_2176 [Acidimicrobiia bacterium]|nr:MAG: hypothetical protein BMS9Abin12_2176 [Acidimicrobiia bacterium]